MFNHFKIAHLMLWGMLLTTCSFISFAQEKESYNDKAYQRSFMDTTVSPGVDFYQYAVGNWVKNTPIPDEYGIWASFTELAETNSQILHRILKKAANAKSPNGSIEQKVGDFYYSGMDSSKIESESYSPIKTLLEKINQLKNENDLYNELVYLQIHVSNPIFNFGSGADAKNSTTVIAQLDQGGIGLPDRDYYLNNDNRSKEIRAKYSEHIQKMFQLTGESKEKARKDAKTVLSIETHLAKASMPRVERRDPNKTYNKMSITDLEKLSPDIEWKKYFKLMGVENPGYINVASTKFFKKISKMLKETPVDIWKPYLKWNLIRSTAPYLSSKFVDENYSFFGQYLNGLKAMQPRWKRVMQAENRYLGEALGQLFVSKTFPPEAKKRAKKIVMTLLDALRERINKLDWMSDATKEKAKEKLNSFTVKIGYPDKWRDYSALDIERNSYITNVLNAAEFLTKLNLSKIGKPNDRSEWRMSPQTVNAYYSQSNNEIVFPAAILQPPFFDPNADDAFNYGAMGAVIGHEMTHGFDDRGRQYDAKGNISDWWTKEDAKKFNAKAKLIIEQYNAYTPIDTFHINGQLTQGENIADLGGVTVALAAFKKTDEYKNNKKIDGLTPVQRFFLSYANIWKNNIRDKALLIRLKTDPHSPGKYRVNGPLSNMPDFYKAFNIKPGAPMERPENIRVKIW